ncbi:hypothetical protein MSG28_005357 [Choristoneura fumiferana]|uniref:Uncharacterized protein n=2 Tax=Choristoneura fumiferana TaxID=7141 RepID=A0ACC0JRB4_CHOFU|nr:hypothetical protein MSG28_005357 [Choristoneura fumiferana]
MGKKNKDTLGRALIKDRFSKNRHKKHVEDNTMLHTTEINDGYDWGRLNLQSVTAESSLQEFLSTAELAQREFTAEKMNLRYVKPTWEGETAEEQLQRERDAFLEWRRHLNELQAKLGAAVTPYERNLELWRQLWRTLEKSDVNVPIIFFSAAKETNKERKISEESDTIKQNKIDSDTESADSEEEVDQKEALQSTEEDIELFKRQIKDLDTAVSNTADRLNKIQDTLDAVLENLRLGKPIILENENDVKKSEKIEDVDNVDNSHEIFDRNRLLEVLKNQKLSNLKNPPRVTVGMIGYPNVGKSSTVNVLMQVKKVSVSSMPGHTRHIQSLVLDSGLELLDCPGLVLPAYAVAPDLLLTAVLPIDQMRAHDAAMARLCQLVVNRGFMTAAGQPDQSRSARLLLKDAASGRLRWAALPPGAPPPPVEELLKETKRKPTPRERRDVVGWVSKSAEIDKAFFAKNKSSAHVKGKPIMG